MPRKKYILGFVGSPRTDGNTDFLVTEILNSARNNGARIEKICLNKLNILPCQGCDYCKTYRHCKQKDDMQLIYEKIRKAHGIVLGSPTYFGNPTGQTKTFIDRFYAFYDRNFRLRIRGRKRGAIVFIWAEKSKSYANHRKPSIDFLASVMQYTLKAKIVGKLVGGGISTIGDAAANEGMTRKAMVIGRRLVV